MKNHKNNNGFTPPQSIFKRGNLAAGFTLIELMVATSLFVIIMMSALGALFMLLDESKNSRALRFATDNINFAMDSMTRSIRMGTDYNADNSTNGISTSISFESQEKENGEGTKDVRYRLTTLGNETNTIEKCTGSGLNTCFPIVSSDVDISVLKFFVTLGTKYTQASVYIIMKGTVMVKKVPTAFAIQTMASQRNF